MNMVAVRCLIQQKGKTLFCHLKKENFYFLPGGTVEHQEQLTDAIARELHEELGLIPEQLSIGSFKCLLEAMYENVHGYSLIFPVKIPAHTPIQSQEPHIDFKWISTEDFKLYDIRPSVITEWIEDGCKSRHIVYIKRITKDNTP